MWDDDDDDDDERKGEGETRCRLIACSFYRSNLVQNTLLNMFRSLQNFDRTDS